jgi:hypothetical protein
MAKSNSTILLQTSFDLTQTCHADMWRNTRDRWKKSRLFLSINPEQQQSKTIDEMFCERFYSPKIGITRQIKKQLINELNTRCPQVKLTEAGVSLNWDRYAGCSCPCSPGYVITFNDRLANVPYDISHGGNFKVSIKI